MAWNVAPESMTKICSSPRHRYRRVQESIELQNRNECGDADSSGQCQGQLHDSVHTPSIWQDFELSRMP